MNRTECCRQLLLICLPFLIGCATSKAPHGWLSSAAEIQKEAFGCWLSADYVEGSQLNHEEGEFIAVQDSFVYVLPPVGGVVRLSMGNITYVVLDIHKKETGKFTRWTALGALSTLSHGFGLILSAPIWLLAGTISTQGVSQLGSLEEENPTVFWWSVVSPYARFPQGLPPSIDLQSILQKYESIEVK